MRFEHEDKVFQAAIEKNKYDKIIKKIGLEKTKTLKKRFNQLKASDNFSVFLNTGLGKPHKLKGDLNKCYGVSITGNYRLVIQPITNTYDEKALKQCETLIVKGVTDYHDGKYKWILP